MLATVTLPNLTGAVGSLTIAQNTGLQTLLLPSLFYIGSSLTLTGNTQLTAFTATAVTTLQRLIIANNAALVSVSAALLVTVTGTGTGTDALTVYNNSVLASLSLPKISSISGYIQVGKACTYIPPDCDLGRRYA